MQIHSQFQYTTAVGSPEERYEHYREELAQALGPLQHDPEIAETWKRRGPHALYNLLLKKQRTARSIDRPLIKKLIQQNRLFVLPVRKTPALVTFNGTGVRLYSADSSNSKEAPRVVTQFVTFLFIPLCPVAQYLAISESGGGWRILGKLPLRPSYELWLGISCSIGIAGVIALALYGGWVMSR